MQMHKFALDSTAVSIFVDTLVELTNTVIVDSTNITTNIETAVLSRVLCQFCQKNNKFQY